MSVNETLEDCDECEGSGKLIVEDDGKIITYKYCKKCRGKGKLNWIEQIFGIKESLLYFENQVLSITTCIQKEGKK